MYQDANETLEEKVMKCEACLAGDHRNCSCSVSCDCDCDGPYGWPHDDNGEDLPCPKCGSTLGHLPNCPDGICRIEGGE